MDRYRKGAVAGIGAVEIQQYFVGAVRSTGACFQGNAGDFTRAKRQAFWRNELIFLAAGRRRPRANPHLVKDQAVPVEVRDMQRQLVHAKTSIKFAVGPEIKGVHRSRIVHFKIQNRQESTIRRAGVGFNHQVFNTTRVEAGGHCVFNSLAADDPYIGKTNFYFVFRTAVPFDFAC